MVTHDKEWYARIKAGDEQAFEALFRTHYVVLCGFARKFVADRDMAEEMVQELFAQLWEKRESLQLEVSVKAYLFTAIRNSCLNHLKHLAVKGRHQDHARQLPEGHARDPLTEMEGAELEARIRLAIASLPDRCREVFQLSRSQGLKYDEIAQQLGISPRTVEVQIGKALRILREQLADWLPLLVFIAGLFLNGEFFT